MTNLTFAERDEFDRKVVAESLLELLSSDIALTPALLHGGWGTGKTEFCEKLIHLHGEADNPDSMTLLRVDAFKSDHTGEPLLALLSAVLGTADEGMQQKLREKALPYLRFGLKTVGKAATGWLLKASAEDLGEDLAAELEQGAESAIDASAEVLLKSHEEAEQSLQALRGALTELTQERPLVLLIDELDRCKPDFAVGMLETVKHVFDVPNLKIVFVTNVDQLQASVRHCYGGGVDAFNYLGKFFKFRFQLPDLAERSAMRPVNVSVKHFRCALANSAIFKGRDNDEWGSGFAESLIVENRLSLRDVERFVLHLEVLHQLSAGRLFRTNVFADALMTVLAVFVYCFAPEHLQGESSGLNVNGVLQLLPMKTLQPYPESDHPSHADVVSAMLICSPGLSSLARENTTKEDRMEWGARIKLYLKNSWDDTSDRPALKIAEAVSYLQLAR